ncbi:hypothetical protein Hanom_Chr16g01427521 [Helianthus anomalus]
MVKFQEVDQSKTSSDNDETKDATQESVSVKKESNEKSESNDKSKSESDGNSENVKSDSGEESDSESGEIGKTRSKLTNKKRFLKRLIQFLKRHAKLFKTLHGLS